MAGKIATRAAYGEALVELAEQYPELVVFDADLSNATMTKGFAAKYPERFFDMGIAECNMVGVAAGMATCGYKPFVNTFAMFAAGRAWEQVRNTVCYPHLNVKVVGSHGGLSVGEDGATHQCTEDLALMRVIPGMKVLCPCDGYEMKLAVKALLEYDGPAYLRLGRAAVETVTDEIEGYKFELDKGVTLKDGKDVTVIATGLMVQMALKAREMMAAEGISVRVIDMHTIKPLDELFRSDSLQRACLLEQDGETAGYGLLSLKYSHEAGGLELWVEELYVRPAFRGRGLGHEFFAWLRGLSAAEHIRRIRLETEPENERAAALYARMGFSPLGYCQMFREEAT